MGVQLQRCVSRVVRSREVHTRKQSLHVKNETAHKVQMKLYRKIIPLRNAKACPSGTSIFTGQKLFCSRKKNVYIVVEFTWAKLTWSLLKRPPKTAYISAHWTSASSRSFYYWASKAKFSDRVLKTSLENLVQYPSDRLKISKTLLPTSMSTLLWPTG